MELKGKANMDDILGQVAETITAKGGDKIPDEVLDKLRDQVLESEHYKSLSPERQEQTRQAFEEQVGSYRGVTLQEASARSLAGILRLGIARLEPLQEGILGLAQAMEKDPPHVFGLGGLHANVRTALFLLEGVERSIVHMATCDCGKGEHAEEPEAKA